VGSYNLTVEDPENLGSTPVTFTGIVVQAGADSQKAADFSGGTLTVNVLRDGKPINADCTVKRAGDQSFITHNWTRNAGSITFKLAVGAYNLTVEDPENLGSTPVAFTGIVVQSRRRLAAGRELHGRDADRQRASRWEARQCPLHDKARRGSEFHHPKLDPQRRVHHVQTRGGRVHPDGRRPRGTWAPCR